MTLRTLNYGNYGIFLIMGNAGFCPSTVVPVMCFSRACSTMTLVSALQRDLRELKAAFYFDCVYLSPKP